MKKIGGFRTDNEEIKKDGFLTDLSIIFGKEMKWLPIAAYLFANICLITRQGKVILVLTEERRDKNIWVIPGGELWYKKQDSFFSAVMREAGKEEMGIKLDPKRIKVLDVQIGYPIKDSPYEDKGITSVIVSYLYFITDEELENININAIPEKGCNIVSVLIKPVPEVLMDIECGEINVYPALKETLNKLNLFLNEGS
jgi:8-oxo-dGTP pyrophosphatase MutT (NUDIX family)